MNERVFQIALAMANGVGPVKARALLARFGTAENIFRAGKEITRVHDIGPATTDALRDKALLRRAEEELLFSENNSVSLIFISDPQYPERLRQCADAPVLLYSRGLANLNAPKVISIVGTRAATAYGKHFCEQLIAAVAAHSPVVVSGLAYGIDICAHRACIKHGVSTVGCLAHGHDRIYPSLHASVANQMMQSGALITEFPSGTRPDRELFPMRNRIIAGVSDCTVVIETDDRGGSMITAHLAHGYGREVFALPGRYDDAHSTGCNLLIRKNIAAILATPRDLAEYLGWDNVHARTAIQPSLFDALTAEEEVFMKALSAEEPAHLDDIVSRSQYPAGRVAELLLDLEFRGVLRSLPGKRYSRIK
jgi:DNA processing protein